MAQLQLAEKDCGKTRVHIAHLHWKSGVYVRCPGVKTIK